MDSPGKTERNVESSQSETEAKDPGLKTERPPLFQPSNIALPAPLIGVLSKYPCLQRHPHPFVVHFPIVFSLSAAFFSLSYLLVRTNSWETTAFHCLGAAVLTTPLAMLTGEVSRRVNYPKDSKRMFLIERRYSWVLLAFSGAAFLWRWLDPTILRNFRWASILYLTMILSLPFLATIISYFGGLQTFPLEKEED